MSYTVKSSEKLRKSGAETETKALLYHMNFQTYSEEIHFFVVDFFNDLTGMDRMAQKLWDVQSKGEHNVSPKAIGKELVTLFKNYVSDFSFEEYILFIGSVSKSICVKQNLTSFHIKDLDENTIEKIRLGLREECIEKSYINNVDVVDEKINNFLSHVLFVVDNDTNPSEYIKEIIKKHPKIIPEERILRAIFNEIRDKQSDKKNVSNVENIIINTTDEALNYCRHLTSSEIRLMTLSRIINRNPMEKGVPISFIQIYSNWPPERQKEMLEDCQAALCRALFNKNMADGFWYIFEKIYHFIIDSPDSSIQELFEKVQKIPEVMCKCPDFDAVSLKYFISIVKDGMQP